MISIEQEPFTLWHICQVGPYRMSNCSFTYLSSDPLVDVYKVTRLSLLQARFYDENVMKLCFSIGENEE